MRRTPFPGLEPLEAKALLSAAPSAASGLVASLTTVVHRSAAGVQVVATLTETNTTDHAISIAHGPSTDGFVATRAGREVWTSGGGMMVAQFLRVDVLKPHQSLSVGATWDGRSNRVDPIDPSKEGPPLSGTFTISGELDHGEATAVVTLPRVPKAGHAAPPKPAATRP